MSDGSACAIVCTPDVARGLGKKDLVAVKALQVAVSNGEEAQFDRWDGSYFATTRVAAARAYAEAGITQPREQGRVFRLEPEQVSALAIEWRGRTVRLEREAGGTEGAGAAAGGWRLVEPFAGRADGALVERLVGDLAGLEIVRRLEGAQRAEVGLEPPRGRLTFRGAGGEGTLELGGEVPASPNVVVAVAGQGEPLVVARTLVTDLDREPGEWRARELLAAGRDQIDRIRLVPRAGEEVVLAPVGDAFVVEQPFVNLVRK